MDEVRREGRQLVSGGTGRDGAGTGGGGNEMD